MKRFRWWLAGLLVATALVACGEEPTATPVPTPTPTPAPTPTATVPAAGRTTPPAGASQAGELPAPSGATLIQIDTATVETLLKAASLPPDLVRNVKFNLYALDVTADKAAEEYGKTLAAAGYNSALPGFGTGLVRQGEQYFGFLTRNDSEALVVVQTLTADFTNAANAAGVSADIVKNVTDQLQGKKSIIITVSGSGLLRLFTGGAGFRINTPTAAPAPTR